MVPGALLLEAVSRIIQQLQRGGPGGLSRFVYILLKSEV